LACDSASSIRFVPNPDWNGTVDAGITFRAWDQTGGTAGDTADTTLNGGETAFSTVLETASITVGPGNDAPSLDSSGTMSFSAVNEDDTTNPGDLVSAILAGAGGTGSPTSTSAPWKGSR